MLFDSRKDTALLSPQIINRHCNKSPVACLCKLMVFISSKSNLNHHFPGAAEADAQPGNESLTCLLQGTKVPTDSMPQLLIQ